MSAEGNPACCFSLAHYSETLRLFKGRGFSFPLFSELSQIDPESRPANFALLRHDIDKSVTKAVWMAEAEHWLGIRSTYFVRVHSNYYNPFGHIVYSQINQIRGLGHEIGLHTEYYDAARISREDPIVMFDREVAVFESIFGQRPAVISPHRTSGSSGTEEVIRLGIEISKRTGIPSAGSAVFNEGIKYLSDSSGIWREGCFCNHVQSGDRFQILTHPDWWYRHFIELEEPVV